MAHALLRPVAIGLIASVLVACAATPQQSRPSAKAVAGDPAARAAHHAARLVGTAYRYGGSSPTTGFDCSGLIHYSYRQAGMILPRSTAEQRRASIRVSDLRQGDLVFFDQEGKKNSHAGIYLGNGDFVHAPSSGKRVRIDRLDSPYWQKHLSEVRRIGS